MPSSRLWLLAAFFGAALLGGPAFASSTGAPEGAVLRGAVNLNTATAEELERLPGIGPKKAREIIEYREQHPFLRVSQLKRIKGFGPETLKRLQPYVVIDGPSDLRWVPADAKE